MTRNPLRRSPLQVPINTPEISRTFEFNRAPTGEDFKNFKIKDTWLQRDPSGIIKYAVYMLVDKTATLGTWLKLGELANEGIVTALKGDDSIIVNPDVAGVIKIAGGTNATTSGTENTITIDATAAPSTLTWIKDTSNSSPIDVNPREAHVANATGVITYNLPATCVLGDTFEFYSAGSGFIVKAGATQKIFIGNAVTALGGSVAYTILGDSLKASCITDNTEFQAYSLQGNFTVN